MKKCNRILSLVFTAVALFSLLAVWVFGAEKRVLDEAGLLSSFEEQKLEEQFGRIEETYGFIVAIGTERYAEGGLESAAYRLADELGSDVMLLYVDMGTRDYRVETNGRVAELYNEAAAEYIQKEFRSLLSEGEYYEAFARFGQDSAYIFEICKDGKEFKEPFHWGIGILISLIVGLVLALIITGTMRSKLKTVRHQKTANSYVRNDSMKVTVAKDYFLYRTVTRVARPKDNGGRSGGGISGGGGGHRGSSGKF